MTSAGLILYETFNPKDVLEAELLALAVLEYQQVVNMIDVGAQDFALAAQNALNAVEQFANSNPVPTGIGVGVGAAYGIYSLVNYFMAADAVVETVEAL